MHGAELLMAVQMSKDFDASILSYSRWRIVRNNCTG